MSVITEWSRGSLTRADDHVKRGRDLRAAFDPVPSGREAWAAVSRSTERIIRESAARKHDEVKAARRTERYRLRRIAGRLNGGRLADCGHRVSGGGVALVNGFRGAGYTGLMLCGQVHTCAVCSAVIRQRRAIEIEQALVQHLAGGGAAVFGTFTVPHKAGNDLDELLRRVGESFRAVISRNRAARDWWEGVGGIGYIRALEVTDGANGWHPHLHVVFLLNQHGARYVDEPMLGYLDGRTLLDEWSAFVDSAWKDVARRNGWPIPKTGRGVVLERISTVDGGRVGQYLSKLQEGLSAGLEMARGDLKAGRRSSRIPFELLAATQDARRLVEREHAEQRWAEYSAAMKGKRAIVWSNGLKARYAIEERTDEELARVDQQGSVIVARISDEQWTALGWLDERAELLTLLEKDGPRAAREHLATVVTRYRDALAQAEYEEQQQPAFSELADEFRRRIGSRYLVKWAS